MNYRHAFHAGNFADLAKHAAVGLLLDALLSKSAPLSIVDTHAGAGIYDLAGIMPRKSGEAEAGVLRLMADPSAPEAFAGLKAAVLRLNRGGAIQLYPGSPRLVAERLRPGDSYLGADIQPEDLALLQQALALVGGQARAVLTDGYDLAAEQAQRPGRLFVLVDPPFERADDYDRAAALAADVLRRKGDAVLAIWAPLKDMETFDRFIRRLEADAGRPADVAELRLRALNNPLRMNGCAMVFFNAPREVLQALKPALDWIADRLGEPGAEARLWRAGD